MSPGLQQLYDSLDDRQKAGLSRVLRQVSHCGRVGGAHEIAAAMTHFKILNAGLNQWPHASGMTFAPRCATSSGKRCARLGPPRSFFLDGPAR